MASKLSLNDWQQSQELLSKQKSPSTASIQRLAELGLIPTNLDSSIILALGMYIVIDRAWRDPFKVGSRFSREGAMVIAIAASEGFITNNIGDDQWDDKWRITEIGMEFKEELNEILRNVFEDSGNHTTH